MMNTLAWVLFGYGMGGIPFGLLFSKKLTGIDLRTHGSGNIGATNAFRTGNKFLGIATFLADFLKGTLPVLCVQHYLFADPYIIGAACVLGHVISIWLLLFTDRSTWGGKGVATALGTLLVLNPLMFLIMILIWALTFFVFRISALSALVAFFLAPLIAFTFNYNVKIQVYLIFLGGLIVITHLENIKKIYGRLSQKK
ncbi:MAG: Glycerol-3-phosphate acyltransferase [Holosporales bacterium]